MTAGLDERRPDHTRPTIAFIALAVAAAAVMTAGMTGGSTESPIAADRPPRVEIASPGPVDHGPSPEPPAFPDFSMADVVTLAAAETEPARRQKRPNAREESPGSDPVTPRQAGSRPSATVGNGTASGSAGTRSGTGSAGSRPKSGSGGSTSGGTGGSGSGGSTSGRPGSGTKDAGPGRSSTGQGNARGQKDASPGRGRGARKSARTAARETGRVDAQKSARTRRR